MTLSLSARATIPAGGTGIRLGRLTYSAFSISKSPGAAEHRMREDFRLALWQIHRAQCVKLDEKYVFE
jgi:hypothetical protein